ncbi:glycosyltransferase [Flavobacterium sp.]
MGKCIIIDDGSTDNTEQIVKNFIKDDIRFIYIKKERRRS